MVINSPSNESAFFFLCGGFSRPPTNTLSPPSDESDGLFTATLPDGFENAIIIGLTKLVCPWPIQL